MDFAEVQAFLEEHKDDDDVKAWIASLGAVTIGPKIDQEFAERGLRSFLQDEGLDEVNISRSRLPLRD